MISYFTSPDREAADMPAIAILHDTLIILSAAEDEHQLSPLVIEPMYAAIDVYLHALPGSGQDPEELDAPPWPDVSDLRDDGLPVRPLEELDESEEAHRRRCRIGALMHHQGWGWQDLEDDRGA